MLGRYKKKITIVFNHFTLINNYLLIKKMEDFYWVILKLKCRQKLWLVIQKHYFCRLKTITLCQQKYFQAKQLSI